MLQTNGGPYDSDKKYCWTRDLPFNQAQVLTDELSKIYTVAQITIPHCNK